MPIVTTAIVVIVAAVVVVVIDVTANISLHDETPHREHKANKMIQKERANDTLACNDDWFSVSEIHTLYLIRIACIRNMRCSQPHCTTQRSTTKTNLDRISFVEKSIYAHQIRINDLDLLVSVSSPYHFITLQFCCLFCCCYCGRRYFILFILLLFVVWTRAHKFPSRFVYITY